MLLFVGNIPHIIRFLRENNPFLRQIRISTTAFCRFFRVLWGVWFRLSRRFSAQYICKKSAVFYKVQTKGVYLKIFKAHSLSPRPFFVKKEFRILCLLHWWGFYIKFYALNQFLWRLLSCF